MKTAPFFSLTIVILVALAFGVSAKEPIFEGLGSYARKITTDSPEAQRYFNQGLAFLHGFNHGAAIASLQEAARLDPKCAMAHWGIALACGPHINLTVMSPSAVEMARLPENGWSLYGLASSLRAQKKNQNEAAATKVRFKRLWAGADTKITSSCLCQPGADRK